MGFFLFFGWNMFWAVMFLFFVELVFWAMPSARAAPGSLHSVAFGEPSPSYPYRVFYNILRLEIGIDGFGVKKHVAS